MTATLWRPSPPSLRDSLAELTLSRLLPGATDEARDPWYGEHGQARSSQHPPPGAWRTWLVMTGRGWGKTRTAAEWARFQIQSGQARRFALVAPTAADARDVMVLGNSGILACCERARFRATYVKGERRIDFANGAVAFTYSAEEPARLRGPEHDGAWADEFAAWERTRQAEAWSNLQLGLRHGKRTRQVVTTTPRPQPILRALQERAADPSVPDRLRVVVTRGSTMENAANVDDAFLDDMTRQYAGTRLGRQELEGELLEDVEGALWSLDLIDQHRWRTDPATGDPTPSLPTLTRIVVAVDPQTGYSLDGEGSETGIVVAGRDADANGYVLADLSGNSQPHEWATRAVEAYRAWRADRIVAEANQGGKMVEETIRTVNALVPITLVHASRGKLARAEPVSSLYQQGRVHHVGGFPALEDQMVTYAPDTAAKSPDRMDALVWGLTELLVGEEVPVVAPGSIVGPSIWGERPDFGSDAPAHILGGGDPW